MSEIAIYPAESDALLLPPLRLNHRFVWEFVDNDYDFTSAEIDVYLDKVGASTPTRVTLTDASPGITRADGSLSCDQSPAWVNTNLSEGVWELHLLVNKIEECWGRFEVITPPAGEYTP